MIPRIAIVACEAFPKVYEDDVPVVPALAALGPVRRRRNN
jgi:hypothetical protein